MKNLIQKLLGKKENIEVRTMLSADEIKPFFESIGVDIENIGFPDIETRHSIPTMRYYTNFDNVRATPIEKNGTLKTIVTGDYIEQAMASYKDGSGNWHPGGLCLYSFRVEEGKLNLKKKK